MRGLGFVGTIAGSKTPAALAIPYLALAATLIFVAWGITRGVSLEPPAFLTNALRGLTEAMARRSAPAAGAAR